MLKKLWRVFWTLVSRPVTTIEIKGTETIPDLDTYARWQVNLCITQTWGLYTEKECGGLVFEKAKPPGLTTEKKPTRNYYSYYSLSSLYWRTSGKYLSRDLSKLVIEEWNAYQRAEEAKGWDKSER